jgi:hypothetical protein
MRLPKPVIIDASSAILLYKTGWMVPLMQRYRVGTGPVVWRELTVGNHPGARAFPRWRRAGLIHVRDDHLVRPRGADGRLDRLGAGERECIGFYLGGNGVFIIVDDGPAAAYCRHEQIPYINALLVPRLLDPDTAADGPGVATAMQQILAIGRYANWVAAYARTCRPEDLAFFRP